MEEGAIFDAPIGDLTTLMGIFTSCKVGGNSSLPPLLKKSDLGVTWFVVLDAAPWSLESTRHRARESRNVSWVSVCEENGPCWIVSTSTRFRWDHEREKNCREIGAGPEGVQYS